MAPQYNDTMQPIYQHSPFSSSQATLAIDPAMANHEMLQSDASSIQNSPTETLHGDEPWQKNEKAKDSCDISSVSSATVVDEQIPKDIKDISAVPSHGRLLPLVPFLIVYACMSLGTFLGALDQTVVSTILPQISTEFGAAQDISWVGTAFLLTSTSFQPVFGSFCDVFGRKASFLSAMMLFCVGTLLCGAAPNIIVLIIARAIAGIGGGGLQTTVQIVVSDVVSLRHRGKYQGILQTMNGLGSCLGPLVGGIFADKVTWRWAFYFQVPIAGAAFIASLFFLPSTGKPSGHFMERFKKIDYIGMVTLVAGVSIFMTGLTYGGSLYPWNSPIIISLLVVGVIVCIGFVYNESKAEVPIIPGNIFKNASVDIMFCANFGFGIVFFCALYYLPLFFQVVYKENAVESGVSLIPLTVTSIFFSWASGLMTSITGNYKISLIVGYALMLISSGLVYTLNEHTPRYLVILYMLMMGCGMGCQLQNSLIAAQSAVAKKDVARTTAVRNFFRNFGGVFGLGISAAILNGTLKGGIETLLGPLLPDSATDAIVQSPLAVHSLGLYDDQEDLAVSVYIIALKFVFLVWIPASAVCFLAGLLVPPYSLDRADDGEPLRKPFFSFVTWTIGKKPKQAESPQVKSPIV